MPKSLVFRSGIWAVRCTFPLDAPVQWLTVKTVKVHYTFDQEAKGNYLARCPRPIEVQTASLDGVNTIGVVDLRACIQTLTDSSPELAGQDGDFMIYSLDYSEPDTPLVGQGMLSWAIESIQRGTPEPKMVTGRVAKNLMGVFGGGSKETLEVRLKLTVAATIIRPEYNRFLEPRLLQQAPPQPQPQSHPHHQPQLQIQPRPQSQHQSQPQPVETVMTPTGTAEWNAFIQSNPQIGQRGPVSRVASPALSIQGPPPMPRQDSVVSNSQPEGPKQDEKRVVPTLVDGQHPSLPTAPSSRPSSRASTRKRKGKPPTGRPRGRPRKNPPEGNTSGYEDGTEGEEGPTKKRAKTTQVDRASINTFAVNPDSLRVAASTSGSIRSFRPVGNKLEAKNTNHLQEVPRAPTPVPDASKKTGPGRSTGTSKLRRQSTMSQDLTPQLTAAFPERLPALSPSQEDGRSPESLAPTPAYSGDSPADIGSSPPVPRTMTYPRSSLPPSSPILPPMPVPQLPNEASFNGDDMTDLFGEEPALEEVVSRQPVSRKAASKNGVPFQVFQIQDGPNGQDLVHIGDCKLPRLNRALSAKGDTSLLPPSKENVRQEQPQKAKAKRAKSPPPQGPTPPPTTDTADKASPMPSVELAHEVVAMKESPATTPQESIPSAIPSIPEQQPGQSFSNQQLSQSFSRQYPSQPLTEQHSFQSFTDKSFSPALTESQVSQSFTEQQPSQPFPEPQPTQAVRDMQPAQPKPSKARPAPKPARQLNRSQSAGALLLPSIPASEPAGPSSLSHCIPAEPERPSTAAARALRRPASTGPLSLPIPASDPVGPTPVLPVDLSLPDDLPMPPPPSSPPTARYSNKNIVKRNAIKQRLEEAIVNGEPPPFCTNCGGIETPTWRKIWVKECEGAPETAEFSEKPGRITAVEILKRDEKEIPILHRVIKKSLAANEKKDGWDVQLLCNPCGIWLNKWKSHRPKDRWEKDASRLGQERKRRAGNNGAPRNKKPRAKNDPQANLTSEAYLMTDALGPVEPSSPNLAPSQEIAERINEKVQLSNETNPTKELSADPDQARGDGTVQSPIDIERDEQLGSTRRVLFPSPKRADPSKALTELHVNVVQIDSRQQRVMTLDKANMTLNVDSATAEHEALESLFRSSTTVRPTTPTDKSPAMVFKTPTRSTPNHRPVTRSVSRSIKASRSQASPVSVRQALFQRTPTRTPRSARRSPRNQDDVEVNPFDTPISRGILQMLSEPNGFDMGDNELDLSSLPGLDEHEASLLDFGNLMSTDAVMPSSPPKGMFSFDYQGSSNVWDWTSLDQSTEMLEGKIVEGDE
jgi:hypothetical protein